MSSSGPIGADLNQPTLLILGGSGYFGRHLLRAASGSPIVATSRTPEQHRTHAGVQWMPVDGWPATLARLRDDGPVTVIHTIALTDHGYCELHPDEAMAVNAETVAQAAMVCRAAEAPLLYVCTDGLFPHASPADSPKYWTRNDSAAPVSAYGRSKLAGERAMMEVGWGHSIRMSFVGAGLGTGRGLLAYLATRLRHNAEIPGYIDNWFSPAPAQDAADRLVDLARTQPSGCGIQQWGCSPAITKYDFLERVAMAAGFSPRMLEVRRATLPNAHTVPLDQSLTCDVSWTLEALIDASVQALREELA